MSRISIAAAVSWSMSFRLNPFAPASSISSLFAKQATRFGEFGLARGHSIQLLRTEKRSPLPFGKGEISRWTHTSQTLFPGAKFFGTERLGITTVSRLSLADSKDLNAPLSLNPALANFDISADYQLPSGFSLLTDPQLSIDIKTFILSIEGNDQRKERTRGIAEHLITMHRDWDSGSVIFKKTIHHKPVGFVGINCEEVSGRYVGILESIVAHPNCPGLGTELLELVVSLSGGREVRVHPAGPEPCEFFMSRGFEVLPFTDGADLYLPENSESWLGRGNHWKVRKVW